MRQGMVILAVFAAAWASLALLLSGGAAPLLLLPILVSAALLASGWRASGLVPPRGPHVGRLVGLWSALEGVGILIAGYALQRLHRDDLILSATVIIIGLHFFPLARGIPARIYHGTGAALVALGFGALLLPRAQQPIAVCLGAALILWATMLVAMRDARRLAHLPAS